MANPLNSRNNKLCGEDNWFAVIAQTKLANKFVIFSKASMASSSSGISYSGQPVNHKWTTFNVFVTCSASSSYSTVKLLLISMGLSSFESVRVTLILSDFNDSDYGQY